MPPKADNRKNVTVPMGSPHKGGATYTAARKLLDDLESYGDSRGEIVALSDYNVGVCRGCKVCFARGRSSARSRTTGTCSSRR